MKIMVDISEKDWKFMQKTYKETGLSFVPEAIKNECVKAVYNGTALPKGHGDLKDASKMIADLNAIKADDHEKNMIIEWTCNIIDGYPTIIEADKEVENGKC